MRLKYFVPFDMGLRVARSPWEIMDVAITTNQWREAYFVPTNLNKPFAWEIAIRDLVPDIVELISGARDLGALGNCVISVGNKFLVGEVAANIGGKWSLASMGRATCGACAVEPTKASCIPCSAYIIYQGYNYAGLLIGAKNCFTQNFGN